MHDSSGETQFTFNGGAAAPAETVSQSSPGTMDSGTQSTPSNWVVYGADGERRRRSATASTPRSSRRSGRHRTGRKSSTRRRSPRTEDPETHGKRRTSESSRGRQSHQSFAEIEEELRQVNESLQRTEAYAASRDRLINDIEVKFTDYLREYHQNVNSEVSALNTRLFQSLNEVSEYQAELMVAAREDAGAVTRIQELERRGAIAESGAKRIYEVGMEMQSQYKDEIHELRGLLSNVQDRLSAANIAQRLYHDGRMMQKNFSNTIMEYQQRSMLSEASSSQLAITNEQNSEIPDSSKNTAIHRTQHRYIHYPRNPQLQCCAWKCRTL